MLFAHVFSVMHSLFYNDLIHTEHIVRECLWPVNCFVLISEGWGSAELLWRCPGAWRLLDPYCGNHNFATNLHPSRSVSKHHQLEKIASNGSINAIYALVSPSRSSRGEAFVKKSVESGFNRSPSPCFPLRPIWYQHNYYDLESRGVWERNSRGSFTEDLVISLV